MKEDPLYISNIEYALGEIKNIDQTTELKNNKLLLDKFKKTGLQYYCEHKGSFFDLALQATENVIKASNIDSEKIDAVIYCTNSLHNIEKDKFDIGNLCNTLNLINAYPIGIFLSDCANINVAIKLASDLAMTSYPNILIISVDTFYQSKTRLVPPNISVLSDGAVSLLISREIPGDYSIIDSVCHRGKRIWDIDPWNISSDEDIKKYCINLYSGFSKSIEKILQKNNMNKETITKFLVNNYNFSFLEFFRYSIRVDKEKIYNKTISDYAHIVAGDTVVNLKKLNNESTLKKGDYLLLVGSAPFSWATNLLVKN
jgi:3-oxoacyl-[acyl-carrier-protein] synthase III